MFVARQDRSEVEAESVHVHLDRPITQAVENHPPHDRLVRVQRIAASGVVGVARLVGTEQVIGVVGEPAQRQRRTLCAAFGGVVVNDVEDHLDAGAVQRLDHVAEFIERRGRVAMHRVTRMRRKKAERLITPVVDEPGGRRAIVEREDREQLDCGNAEILQISDLVDHAGERTAPRGGHAGTRIARESADVQFVDDGTSEWQP